MKVIGLTGGIGSGKSTFCELMAEHGIATVDTDQISRQVVKPNSAGLAQVVKEFGVEILNSDDSLNRAALREKIFADPLDQSARQKLEMILHPLIHAETQKQIQDYQQDESYQAPYLLVAIPLLVEGILKKGHKPDYVDEIWVLDCSEETQIQRASQRDGVNLENIKNILEHQASREQRQSYADKIIHNDGDLAKLNEQIKKFFSPTKARSH